jgi:F-type H+-transporting ATPase subunit b
MILERPMKTPGARFLPIAAALIAAAAALPQAAFAAEEGNKWGIWLDIGRTFNLLFVLGAVVWIARKPLSNFFSGRTQSIQEQLAEAQKARREAEAALAEMESRMSRLEDELREIKDTAEKEAREEYRRLLDAAEQDAEKIIERSKQEIEGITRAAQLELKVHVAELAVKLAENKIRSEITDSDQGRLFERFVTQLGGKP